ncbi:CLUMA_CG000894, isoform A [Clunio marinus]|uniref:CLUMA_CG000894, isoform A n=1 Tax=Clunio marinus TaxID=568069 RepID=A0A1J1HLE8_9DIPT|nr:CLUMA_CG000894, isoform A [Clunio marinus]
MIQIRIEAEKGIDVRAKIGWNVNETSDSRHRQQRGMPVTLLMLSLILRMLFDALKEMTENAYNGTFLKAMPLLKKWQFLKNDLRNIC